MRDRTVVLIESIVKESKKQRDIFDKIEKERAKVEKKLTEEKTVVQTSNHILASRRKTTSVKKELYKEEHLLYLERVYPKLSLLRKNCLSCAKYINQLEEFEIAVSKYLNDATLREFEALKNEQVHLKTLKLKLKPRSQQKFVYKRKWNDYFTQKKSWLENIEDEIRGIKRLRSELLASNDSIDEVSRSMISFIKIQKSKESFSPSSILKPLGPLICVAESLNTVISRTQTAKSLLVELLDVDRHFFVRRCEKKTEELLIKLNQQQMEINNLKREMSVRYSQELCLE